MSIRLTLRTLLSYLDDTLEPAQAKIIGAKVAESEQARELMERIKQVTRRRRLTTPTASGPGGIDPNTIAEYLDSEVTPETAAEVEQICLASDVHLAEVAACHQILTLVLGEPALVPPSAKQRMYGLIKGPEAIPFRKPSKTPAKAELDLSSEIEPDQDETLRLGVPAVGGRGNRRNLWLLLGGGALAACLLAVAVWQLVHTANNPIAEHKGGDQLVKADARDKTDLPKDDAEKKPPEVKKDKDEKVEPVKKDKDDEPKPALPNQPAVEPVEVKPLPEVEYRPASTKQAPVGIFFQPNLVKEPAVLLQAKSDKSAAKSDKFSWVRVVGKNAEVVSARPLMSLSGSKSIVILETGVELTLWGNLPELTLDPLLLESRVTVHANEQLDADLTLLRGRIVIRNKRMDKNAHVRVRFDNPTLNEENHFDLILNGMDAAVIIERNSEMDRDEPFYENKDDKMRKGPIATMRIYAYSKSANIRSGQVSYTLDEVQQPMLQWQSRQGVLGPPPQARLPVWFKGTPPLKEESEKQARDKAVKAAEALAVDPLTKKPIEKSIDVALLETFQEVQAAAQRTPGKKGIDPDVFARWRHAIRCSMAIDNINYLFDEFAQDGTPLFIRGLCMQSLQQWLALSRDHDYQLLAVIKDKHRKTESIKIMELFHFVSVSDARKPVTYQNLIEGLNNELMPIRVLSHSHLFGLVPAGRSIPYDPAMSRSDRELAVRAWLRLIPPGELPPTGAPMKK